MKKSNEITLKEAIQELLNSYKLQDGIQSSRVIKAWEEIAGEFIAKNTTDLYIRNHILFVRLNSAALKNELSFSKTELIGKLNAVTGQETVKEIVLL